MMKILVTGSEGQVGTEFKKMVSDVCSKNKFVFTSRKGNPDLGIIPLDITSKEDVELAMKIEKFDVVINLAAYTDVNGAEKDIDSAMKVNRDAVRYIADACAANETLLIHISTDYVFDGTKGTMYDENDEKNPLNAYGKSKSEGEDAVINSGCDYIILRTQWVYSNNGRNFFKTMFKLLVNKLNKGDFSQNNFLKIVFDQVGTPTSAAEISRALLHIVDDYDKGELFSRQGVYNFRNEGFTTWYDFTVEIAELLDEHVRNDYMLSRSAMIPVFTKDYNEIVRKGGGIVAERPLMTMLDINKFMLVFDYVPHHWYSELKDAFKREVGNTKFD